MNTQSSSSMVENEQEETEATSAPAASTQARRSSRSSRRKSDSAFRTISEVADALDVQQHVLRFWETKFSQIRPLKRGGGRRYYRPEDVALLKTIHHLLYTEGYTIKGVQKLLKEQGKNQVIQETKPEAAAKAGLSAPSQPIASKPQQQSGLDDTNRTVLETMLKELKELRKLVLAEE